MTLVRSIANNFDFDSNETYAQDDEHNSFRDVSNKTVMERKHENCRQAMKT